MLVHRGLSDLMPRTVHATSDNHEGAQMGLFGEYSGLADDKDLELVSKRQASRELLEQKNQGFNPLCGDVVIFPGGRQTADQLRLGPRGAAGWHSDQPWRAMVLGRHGRNGLQRFTSRIDSRGHPDLCGIAHRRCCMDLPP